MIYTRYLCQFVKSYDSVTFSYFFYTDKSSSVTKLNQQNTRYYYNLLHLWNEYKLYLKVKKYSSASINLATVRGASNTNILSKRYRIKPFLEQTTQTCSELSILKPSMLCSLNYPPAMCDLTTEIRFDIFSKILICKCKGGKRTLLDCPHLLLLYIK